MWITGGKRLSRYPNVRRISFRLTVIGRWALHLRCNGFSSHFSAIFAIHGAFRRPLLPIILIPILPKLIAQTSTVPRRFTGKIRLRLTFTHCG
jgi:hypothetical protein